MTVHNIGLAAGTIKLLEQRKVFKVNDLLHCSREELLSISDSGQGMLEELYKALERLGFYRKGRETEQKDIWK